MQQSGEIRISGGGARLAVDIQGTIGVPAWWEFPSDAQREAAAERFRRQVERLGQSAARRIDVRIRSVGGNIDDALLIYDTLRALADAGAEVTTHCGGYTASAATVVAQAASPGRRYISPGSLYLVHNCTTALEGNRLDAERTARMLGKSDERVAQIYADRSGRPAGEFLDLMSRDGGRGEWLAPEEAVAAGLADEVGRPGRLTAVYGRVAEGIRGILGGRSAAVSEVSEPVPVSAQAVVSESVPVGGEALRERVLPTATLPREDPSMMPLSGLGEGSADDPYSPNGTAYDLDARRLRTGC